MYIFISACMYVCTYYTLCFPSSVAHWKGEVFGERRDTVHKTCVLKTRARECVYPCTALGIPVTGVHLNWCIQSNQVKECQHHIYHLITCRGHPIIVDRTNIVVVSICMSVHTVHMCTYICTVQIAW